MRALVASSVARRAARARRARHRVASNAHVSRPSRESSRASSPARAPSAANRLASVARDRALASMRSNAPRRSIATATRDGDADLERVRPRRGSHIDLRIWSAGCSTGEEAYSILVSLMEYFGEEYWNITCGVLATDISKKSLSIASKAIYETKKIDKLSLEQILGFTETLQNGKLCFTEKIRKEANFQQLNLNSKTFPFKNRFHIIFCRNVLIYFNQKSRIAAENKILQSLENGGYIFLGDAEVFMSRDYELEQLGNGVYRKRL